MHHYTKYIIGAVIIIVIVFILLIGRVMMGQSPINNFGASEIPSNVDDETRINFLERQLQDLKGTKPATSSTPAKTQGTVDTKIANLEAAVANLALRIAALETRTVATSSQTTTATSSKTSVYIPLGPGSSSNSLDWTTVDLPQIVINTDDYAGYKNMYLEVFLSVYQGNGTAYAMLTNITDGLSFPNSQVSTSNFDYTLVSSNAFQITPGTKTYGLQLKTTTGYAAQVQFARIRVDF